MTRKECCPVLDTISVVHDIKGLKATRKLNKHTVLHDECVIHLHFIQILHVNAQIVNVNTVLQYTSMHHHDENIG